MSGNAQLRRVTRCTILETMKERAAHTKSLDRVQLSGSSNEQFAKETEELQPSPLLTRVEKTRAIAK